MWKNVYIGFSKKRLFVHRKSSATRNKQQKLFSQISVLDETLSTWSNIRLHDFLLKHLKYVEKCLGFCKKLLFCAEKIIGD